MWKLVQGLASHQITRVLVGTAAAATLMGAGASDTNAQVTQQQSGDSDYHVVAQGDTMWDLSGRYYGDTYEWPRMWSYNAHITNPHWIYPGDIVYLRDDNGGSGTAQPGHQQANSQSNAGKPMAEGMYLPVGGYITKDEVQYVGRITASRKEANMLAEHDTAWVGWGEGAYTDTEKEEIDKEDRKAVANPGEVQTGDRFAVVREVGALTNDDDEVVAHKYLVLGAVTVTKVAGTDDEGKKKYYDEVKVTQSWQEIYRGDFLIPYERQLKVVKQSKADTDEVAKVVDTLTPGNMFGEHSYVFLDKGAADGVRMGNRFFAYQRYEGIHLGLDRPLDEKVPWTQVGQLLVLDVREHYSTALVIDSKRELVVGDRLEMYNGY